MEIYPYTVKLIDPLYYSHEALSGAYTPKYLHATAINHAVTWSMGRSREDQSYIISDATGGRNTPRYEHSWIEPDFYFTPGAINGEADYITEIVKGDMDYFIQPGFGQAKINGQNIGRNEVLKAYRIFFLPPETEFVGYLYAKQDVVGFMPKYIRLGSFRGIAELEIGKQIKTVGVLSNQYVDHPVDPLVSKVVKGTMIGMFPYPIVDNAMAESVYEIRKKGGSAFVAIPSRLVKYDKDDLLQRLNNARKGFAKAKDTSLPLMDRAYLIFYMLRTAASVKLYLEGIFSEERLNELIKEVDDIEDIRNASKGLNVFIENTKLAGLIEKIGVIADDCEEKIKGDSVSRKPKGTGEGSSSIIL